MLRISRWAAGAGFGRALLFLAALAGPGSARADVVKVFNLSGDFDNGSTLSGTATIDATMGAVTALNAVADGFGFTQIITQGPQVEDYLVGAVDGKAAHFGLFFAVSSLVNYGGGSLSTFTRVDDLRDGSGTNLTSGGATFVSTLPVPEPSSWALLIIGFAGVGFFAVRRAGRAAATIA